MSHAVKKVSLYFSFFKTSQGASPQTQKIAKKSQWAIFEFSNWKDHQFLLPKALIFESESIIRDQISFFMNSSFDHSFALQACQEIADKFSKIYHQTKIMHYAEGKLSQNLFKTRSLKWDEKKFNKIRARQTTIFTYNWLSVLISARKLWFFLIFKKHSKYLIICLGGSSSEVSDVTDLCYRYSPQFQSHPSWNRPNLLDLDFSFFLPLGSWSLLPRLALSN